MEGRDFFIKVKKRLNYVRQEYADNFKSKAIKIFNRWPCLSKKYLMVGSESSGTTAISNLLFLEIPFIRFLEEGDHQWVWDVYQSVYLRRKKINDYPRLQLFDAIKVPGFATIIKEFRECFPNTKVVYIIRDPRDFVNSAIKTWKVSNVKDLSSVSWSKENWLNIPNTDPLERLSVRWKRYINSAMILDDIIFVKYEDFCSSKVSTIKGLTAQLGIPFNENRVMSLAELQLSHKSVRDYKPIGPGGWRTGILKSEHINIIEKICKKEMIQWGYTLETL